MLMIRKKKKRLCSFQCVHYCADTSFCNSQNSRTRPMQTHTNNFITCSTTPTHTGNSITACVRPLLRHISAPQRGDVTSEDFSMELLTKTLFLCLALALAKAAPTWVSMHRFLLKLHFKWVIWVRKSVSWYPEPSWWNFYKPWKEEARNSTLI